MKESALRRSSAIRANQCTLPSTMIRLERGGDPDGIGCSSRCSSRRFTKFCAKRKASTSQVGGMRDLYREEYGVKCFSVYLHVPELPTLAEKPREGHLTIGHIGTLYHPEPFRRFLSASKKEAAERNRVLRVLGIGASPEMEVFARENPGLFESYDDLAEEAALPLLAGCDLLYAMYPPGKKYQLFRRTSLPVKLSTYVQARRPIFAHSPMDSTLGRTVNSYGVGEVCEAQDENEIRHKIAKLLKAGVAPDRFEALRKELMGREQVDQLGAALRGRPWSDFKEYTFPQ